MLKDLDNFMAGSFHRLCTVLSCFVDDDFNDTHDKLMAEVREPMMNIVDKVGGLLVASVETIDVHCVFSCIRHGVTSQIITQVRKGTLTDPLSSTKTLVW